MAVAAKTESGRTDGARRWSVGSYDGRRTLNGRHRWRRPRRQAEAALLMPHASIGAVPMEDGNHGIHRPQKFSVVATIRPFFRFVKAREPRPDLRTRRIARRAITDKFTGRRVQPT